MRKVGQKRSEDSIVRTNNYLSLPVAVSILAVCGLPTLGIQKCLYNYTVGLQTARVNMMIAATPPLLCHTACLYNYSRSANCTGESDDCCNTTIVVSLSMSVQLQKVCKLHG